MKTIPIIGSDFVDACGIRLTSFQLCRARAGGGVEAIAIVNLEDGAMVKSVAVRSFEHRKPAIERLAQRYAARSIPVVFRSSLVEGGAK